MENQIKNIVDSLISQIKSKYKDLVINYDFNEEDGTYEIWHNSEHLEFEDDEFTNYVGTLIKTLLFDNGIFNISFGYDYEKSKNLNEMYNVVQANEIIKPNNKMLGTITNTFKFIITETVTNVRYTQDQKVGVSAIQLLNGANSYSFCNSSDKRELDRFQLLKSLDLTNAA